MNKVVLDANVYVKLFKQESDSQQAIDLINRLVREGTAIMAPSVVVNETMTTCEINKQDISPVLDLFCVLLDSNLQMVEIDGDLMKQAVHMTQQGHEKSGYPTFSDCLYQVVAIREGALFITADKRHYAKTKHLGNIALLERFSA